MMTRMLKESHGELCWSRSPRWHLPPSPETPHCQSRRTRSAKTQREQSHTYTHSYLLALAHKHMLSLSLSSLSLSHTHNTHTPHTHTHTHTHTHAHTHTHTHTHTPGGVYVSMEVWPMSDCRLDGNSTAIFLSLCCSSAAWTASEWTSERKRQSFYKCIKSANTSYVYVCVCVE